MANTSRCNECSVNGLSCIEHKSHILKWWVGTCKQSACPAAAARCSGDRSKQSPPLIASGVAAATRSRRQSAWPAAAAVCTALPIEMTSPSTSVVRRCTLAPLASSIRTVSRLPTCAAACKGERSWSSSMSRTWGSLSTRIWKHNSVFHLAGTVHGSP